jgi:hypothetical protein
MATDKCYSLRAALFRVPIRFGHRLLRHRKIATYVVATYLFWLVQAPTLIGSMTNENALFQRLALVFVLLSPITVPVGLLALSAMVVLASGPDVPGSEPRLLFFLYAWGIAAISVAVAYVLVRFIEKRLGMLLAKPLPNGGMGRS